MTIDTIYEPDIYNGDDSTDTFPITFAYLSTSTYIKVSIRDTDEVLTEKTAGTHYNVTSDNVVFTAGNIPATGETVIIELDPNFKQESDYAENDTFPAETLEDDLDKLCLEVQLLLDQSNRSIKVDADVDVDTLDLEDYINNAFDLDITEHWTTATSSLSNALRFDEATDNGTNYVKIQSPTSVSSNVTFTLPGADGSNGQILSTNGSGVLSFIAASSLPAGGTAGQILISDGAGGGSWSDSTESDTWTPTLNSTNSNCTLTPNTGLGIYTKVGNIVIASGYITVTFSGGATGTGNTVIANLPFASSNTSGNFTSCSVSGYADPGTVLQVTSGLIPAGSSYIIIYGKENWDDFPIPLPIATFASGIGNTLILYFTATYIA